MCIRDSPKDAYRFDHRCPGWNVLAYYTGHGYQPGVTIQEMTSRSSITYKDSGVDIDAGEALVQRISQAVSRTKRPEVLGGLGGFGGLFKLSVDRYRQPILVSGADGVGTKLKLAIEHGAHDEVGIDLVAMCVNDVIVQGAEPLFFLDYFVTPRLNVDLSLIHI